MKKQVFLIFLVLLVTAQLMNRFVGAYEIDKVNKMMSGRISEIASKNPSVSFDVLKKDIDFVSKNARDTGLARLNIPEIEKAKALADAWVDIRSRNLVDPKEPISSMKAFDRYGVLQVKTTPRQGATVIFNRVEVWDEKTNVQKGVLSRQHLVQVELEGYEPEPEKLEIFVRPGDSMTIEFVLHQKK